MQEFDRIHYIKVCQKLRIVTQLLKLEMYSDLKDKYSQMFESLKSDEYSRSVSSKVKEISQLIANQNYGQAIYLLEKLIDSIFAKVFSFRCHRNTNSFLSTDEDDVYFCPDCSKNVYKVKTNEEFEIRASLGQCVMHVSDPISYSGLRSCDVDNRSGDALFGSPMYAPDPFDNI